MSGGCSVDVRWMFGGCSEDVSEDVSVDVQKCSVDVRGGSELIAGCSMDVRWIFNADSLGVR